MKDPADAEVFGRRQALLIVIDVEGSRRIKTDQPAATRPIFRSHLEPSDFEGVHDAIHLLVQPGFGCFDATPARWAFVKIVTRLPNHHRDSKNSSASGRNPIMWSSSRCIATTSISTRSVQ